MRRPGRRPRSRTAWTLGLLSALTLTALAIPCSADEREALELAKNPFDAGQFGEAHARLSALLDPSLPLCEAQRPPGRCRIADPDLVEQARALDAASLLALKREGEADAQIAKILRQNPQYAPNPALFPQEVIDRFTMVRGTLRRELEDIAALRAKEELQKRVAAQKAREADEKWVVELQRLASERVSPASRFVAMVPFGVGQFQNGDTRLGITFAVGEVLLGGASLVAIAVVNKIASTEVTYATSNDELARLNTQLRTASVVNQVTFAAWAALTVAGVVQAQVAFIPERPLPKRPIPPRPRLVPVASPVPGGAVIGVVGTF